MRGTGNYRPNPETQKATLAEIAAHREISFAEFESLLTIDEIVAVNDYQMETTARDLLAQPLPPTLRASKPEGAAALRNNTSVYEDDFEDLLYTDSVLSQLLEQAASDQRATAIRARRSVVALLLTLPASDEVTGAA